MSLSQAMVVSTWKGASDQVLTQTMNSLGSQGWGVLFASTQIEEVFFGTNVWPGLKQSSGGLTERSHGQHPIPHTHVSLQHPISTSVFQGASSASLLVPAPLEFGNLLVWSGSCGVRWRVKQEQGCLETSVSKTWTFCQWSLMVCPSFTAHSWPWTPQWSAQCEQTELPGGNVQNGMEPFWTKPVAPKCAFCPEVTGEHGRARLVLFACETGGRWSEPSEGPVGAPCEMQQLYFPRRGVVIRFHNVPRDSSGMR